LKSRHFSYAIALNFALESAIRKVQANQEGFKLNGIYHLSVYADGGNLLPKSMHTVKKHTQSLLVDSEEIDLLANAEKTKFIFTPREQNTGQYDNIKMSNKSLEIARKFKKLEGKEP
jgi:hypothetical protein